MELTAIVKNIMDNTTTHHCLDIPADYSLQNLLDALGCGPSFFPAYYPFHSKYILDDNWVPFIITNNKIQYSVLYSDVKIIDFLNTHQIEDATIHVETGYPLAGGLGPSELLDMWNAVYPWLDQIATALCITGASIKGIKAFGRKMAKQDHTPMTLLDIIYLRNQWNHFEFAQYLKIDPDMAKDMLYTFGFVYNREKMLFVPGPDFEKIKEKFLNIDMRDY